MALEITIPKNANEVKVLMDGIDITAKLDLSSIDVSVCAGDLTQVTMRGYATVTVLPELGLNHVIYNNQGLPQTRPVFTSRLGTSKRRGWTNGS